MLILFREIQHSLYDEDNFCSLLPIQARPLGIPAMILGNGVHALRHCEIVRPVITSLLRFCHFSMHCICSLYLYSATSRCRPTSVQLQLCSCCLVCIHHIVTPLFNFIREASTYFPASLQKFRCFIAAYIYSVGKLGARFRGFIFEDATGTVRLTNNFLINLRTTRHRANASAY